MPEKKAKTTDLKANELTFEINGQTVQIKPMKIKYQKQFARAFSGLVNSVVDSFSSNMMELTAIDQGVTHYTQKSFKDFSVVEWLSVSNAILDNADLLPRLIQILCHNDDYLITDEELDNSTMQVSEQQAALMKFCKLSNGPTAKMADFFEHILPIAEQGAMEFIQMAQGAIENQFSAPAISKKTKKA